jgi:hypothetical protein
MELPYYSAIALRSVRQHAAEMPAHHVYGTPHTIAKLWNQLRCSATDD